jgi:Cyanobacterial and plant NDH-1 subunit O
LDSTSLFDVGDFWVELGEWAIDNLGTGKIMAAKKGSMVRVIRDQLENSLEAQASDQRLPNYLFNTPGEVLDVRGEYAFVKFGATPTPNIWLRLDQLEDFA